MNRHPFLARSVLALLLVPAATFAIPAAAQEIAPPPTPNADRLAEQMRVLARDPRNVPALLAAGELSARLNDPSAAAGFLARAQALEPGNPRVQAAQAMVMVRMERPGEALRLFAEAARAGVAMERYASDRALAYDLIGAQMHAQRDHRVAMRDNPDDEAIRRFALSLGISGKTDEAMQVLDPLLRRSDRAAWRARAFIQAMNGDAAGADRIAASMMGGFGTALSPFFRRLPSLSAADKAFAVHFGELRRTPARIADASIAPPLPQLPPERGVAVVAVQMPGTPQAEAREARRVPPRDRRAEREAAQRATREAEAKRVAELKAQQERAMQVAAQQREADRLAAEQRAAREAEARRVADAQVREAEARQAAERQMRDRAAAEAAARAREEERVAQATTPPVAVTPTPAPSIAAASPPTASPPAQSPSPVTPAPVQQATAAPEPAPMPVSPQPRPQPEAVQRAAAQIPALPPTAPPPTATPTPPAIGREDNVIARIVAGITIPASELGVQPMPGEQAAPVSPPVEVARAEVTQPVTVAKPPAPEPKPAAKPAVKPKAEAVKAKPKPDPAKAEPARHWAQVAGGADVTALPKEWKRLIDKAPAEFRGKQAWTTPLRFTNRLLAGPFKTPGEAQAFVNAIGKKGVSAFAWTSEAGQKIEKLAVK